MSYRKESISEKHIEKVFERSHFCLKYELFLKTNKSQEANFYPTKKPLVEVLGIGRALAIYRDFLILESFRVWDRVFQQMKI